jgi:hypothetical protein
LAWAQPGGEPLAATAKRLEATSEKRKIVPSQNEKLYNEN